MGRPRLRTSAGMRSTDVHKRRSVEETFWITIEVVVDEQFQIFNFSVESYNTAIKKDSRKFKDGDSFAFTVDSPVSDVAWGYPYREYHSMGENLHVNWLHGTTWTTMINHCIENISFYGRLL
jgi:hypothetical protein